MILERIGHLSGSTLADVLDVGVDGYVELSLDQAAENGALSMIREYTQESNTHGVLTRKLKMHDPRPCLELLAKHAGSIGSQAGMA